MSLFNSVVDYLQRLKVEFVERFVPTYIASALMHEFNKFNLENEVWVEHGRAVNSRLHLLFVSPPGFFKSFLLQLLLEGPTSIFGPVIPCDFEQSMTEAAYSGSLVLGANNETIQKPGAAYEHREKILGCEEFAAVTNLMRQEHSINLDVALLTSLDSGKLMKRLRLGKLSYFTNLTLWAASQPTRLDLSSGLGRRFNFFYFAPSKKEEAAVKRAHREGKSIRPNLPELKAIHEELATIRLKIPQIETIEFDKALYYLLDKINVPHYEEALLERQALGYILATQKFGKHIVVKADNDLSKMFKQAYSWRMEIKRGPEEGQLMTILEDEGFLTRTEFCDTATRFGLAYSKTGYLIDVLTKQGRIREIEEKTPAGKIRKVYTVVK